MSFANDSGGREGIRTPDPLLAKQVLSQLSYTPAAFAKRLILYPVVAGLVGLSTYARVRSPIAGFIHLRRSPSIVVGSRVTRPIDLALRLATMRSGEGVRH